MGLHIDIDKQVWVSRNHLSQRNIKVFQFTHFFWVMLIKIWYQNIPYPSCYNSATFLMILTQLKNIFYIFTISRFFGRLHYQGPQLFSNQGFGMDIKMWFSNGKTNVLITVIFPMGVKYIFSHCLSIDLICKVLVHNLMVVFYPILHQNIFQEE